MKALTTTNKYSATSNSVKRGAQFNMRTTGMQLKQI